MSIKEKLQDYFSTVPHLVFGEQTKERMVQAKLAQIIISSADPEELKNKVVKEIAIALGASRCSFLEYDSSKNSFKKITNSYSRKREAISLLGYDIQKDLPNYALKMKYMNDLVFDDTHAYIRKNNLQNSPEANFINKYNIQAFIAVRLGYGENFLGMLIVHYDHSRPFINSIDKRFLVNIAEHISIALHLSMLYVEEKRKKEKEQLLRYIISIMSEGYDLSKITNKIFDILGRILDAQSIFIDVKTETLRNDYIYNLVPYKSIKVEASIKKAFITIYGYKEFENVKKQTHYVRDTNNFILQNNLENSCIHKFFKKNNVNSFVLFPILKDFNQYGNVIIQLEGKNTLSSDDLAFIESVINQLAIVIDQTNTFEKQKNTALREGLLRRVTERIRSSLDLEETLSFICKETANVFGVQRVAITQITDFENKGDIKLLKEYQTSQEIKGVAHTDNFQPVAKYWNYELLKDCEIATLDDIEHNNSPDYIRNTYHSLNIRSTMGAAIKKDLGGEPWGAIILSHYNKIKNWNDEEKIVLKSIANQIYIAIKQAELYSSLKKSAEREKLLRKIFEMMRKTLDVNVIKSTIVSEIGKALDADICLFATKHNDEELYTIDEYSEYLSSPDEKSSVNINTNDISVRFFNESLKKKKDINYSNVEEFIAANNLYGTPEENYLRERGIKSSYTVQVSYNNSCAYLILHYTKKIKKLDSSEHDFLKLVTDQAGIALHQANLYQMTQYQAERERINRSILEILRNSLEKDVIKTLFVKNIGKFFKADRVFFIDYDTKYRKFLPVDKSAEYLSSPDIKSIVSLDWSNLSMQEYIRILQEKRELKISCWDEFEKEDPRSTDFLERFQDSGIHSSYSLPVIYEDKLFGYFCIEFAGDKCNKFSNEDITRIRNLCTQAGIAMYHSELYKKAQQAAKVREETISNINERLTYPIRDIINISQNLVDSDGKDQVTHESLQKIINRGQELLELKESLS